MGQSPDQLRAEIDQLRGDLSTLVEAVGERVSPRRVVRRSANSVSDSVRSITDSVMGTAESAVETVQAQGRRARQKARPSSSRSRATGAGSGGGNRTAIGLVALGAGMLAASLLPPSQAESEAVEELKGAAMRLRDDLKETGRSMVTDLRPELEASKDVVVARGQRSATRVARSAAGSGQKVKAQAKSGARRTKSTAAGQARRARAS